MSRKNFFIIISIFLIVLILCLVAYYFLIMSNGTSGTNSSSIFRQFFPFGSTSSTTPETKSGGEGEEIPTTTDFTKRLRKIWSEPVAGAGVVDVKPGTVIRHVETATGHIYETELFSANQARISNKTIPLIYSAVWNNKNKNFIAQTLKEDNKTINTSVLTVKDISSTTEREVSGYDLGDNISEIVLNDNSMFYLKQINSGTQGFVSAMDGLKRRQVWNSEIRELNVQFVSNQIVSLTTKPYKNIPGYSYTVNTGSGGVKRVLGNIPGLSTLMSPSASKIIYISQTSNVDMFLYKVSDEASTKVSPTTFPEKCVWSKKDENIVFCAVPRENLSGSSLNSWYMGDLSFTDDIWKFDLKQNTCSVISSLSDEGGEKIDVIKPILNTGEQYIVFINKIDGSLWSLDITK